MIGQINNAIRLQVARIFARFFTTRYGIVTGYDPATYSVKVSIQPEGFATGSIPLATQWAGNGWGLFCPPPIGAQVSLIFIDGHIEASYSSCAFYNAQNAPLNVPSGEFWIVHKKLGYFKLTNDGAVAFSDGHGATLTMDGSGNINTAANQWTHMGPLTIDGNLNVSGTIDSTGDGLIQGVNIKTHTHSGVSTGTGASGPPV